MNWLSLSGWAMEKCSLSSLLPQNSKVTEVDYHFFDDASFPDDRELEKFIPEGPYNIICYSMGTLTALKLCLIKKPEKMISICGFTHFPGCGREAKRRKLNILQMIKGLKNNPTKTLEDFSIQAGLQLPELKFINQANLIKGLELLKDADTSLASQGVNIKLLSIYGNNDLIVPEAITDQMVPDHGNRQKVCLTGGHGIVQTHVNNIQELIRNF
jgi:hypothetical protein